MPIKENESDLEPLFSAQQNQLNLVVGNSDSIDNKALATLAIIVAILIFIGQAKLNLSGWQTIALLGPFCLALAASCVAIWPRSYLGSSALGNHPEYLSMPKTELILQLLADSLYATEHNARLNSLRWRFCVAALALTAIGTIVLFAIL